jgi:hypothetical protein
MSDNINRIKRTFSFGNYTGSIKDVFKTNIVRRSVPKLMDCVILQKHM